jgi:hypothetical protein
MSIETTATEESSGLESALKIGSDLERQNRRTVPLET